uniref:Uncharacterized protein n=1 Tax=Rhinella marina erythrocytic-like virus TaxID=2859906 RepID=A0A8F6UAX9_9VIRU|nr:Uvr/REP helicase/Hypothetical protein Clostridium tetani [Rhinella marina erythrocytic-like virus]
MYSAPIPKDSLKQSSSKLCPVIGDFKKAGLFVVNGLPNISSSALHVISSPLDLDCVG